jgi:hypothetical protein
MPFPCHATTMPYWKRLLMATAEHGMGTAWERHGMSELASAVQRRHVGDLPAFGSFRLQRGIPRKLLKCRTSSSDISGYHTDFHERHGNVGEWQGRGMASVNLRGRWTACVRHDMCELAFRVPRMCLQEFLWQSVQARNCSNLYLCVMVRKNFANGHFLQISFTVPLGRLK